MDTFEEKGKAHFVRRNVQIVYFKQQNTCGGCHQLLSLPYFQLDHIIGLQFGGTNEESNLMALCGDCHNIKSICENKNKKDIQEYIHSIWRDRRIISQP